MKKISVLLILMVVFTLFASPAGAMIGGELDTKHTNVGAIVSEWEEYGDILARICTGTLIHPQVLLTAAHCTELLIEANRVPDKVWVTFEENALIGTPEANPDIYLEITEIINHPDFGPGKEYHHDIALIFLAEAVDVEGITHEELPGQGYLDGILEQPPRGKGQRDLDLVFVGYGATGNWELPYLHLDAVRRVGTATFVNLLPLEILTNNSSPDDAVICSGDSGGPIFHVIDQENEVFVGIHSRSGSSSISCDGLGLEIKTRLDTASALGFINDTIAANIPPD